MPSEFDLIARHFTRPVGHTTLGVGDDCALLAPAPGLSLAVSSDMLVAGTHFFPDADPEALGWKTLAVNVSDLAAMGAQPRWATLSLALPENLAGNDIWLTAFSHGFFACANEFGVDLVGGDTTRGPLTMSVTILGEVPIDQALRRSGAVADDDIWVSGEPGLAALGLAHLQGRISLLDAGPSLNALHRPQPRVALGLALRPLASAAIDISDGLLADLGHLLIASGVSARLDWPALPQSALHQGTDSNIARDCLLAGGDDYELLFTAPGSSRDRIEALSGIAPLHRIGSITLDNPGQIILLDAHHHPLPLGKRGFDHFA